jgi:hypothetical protein
VLIHLDVRRAGPRSAAVTAGPFPTVAKKCKDALQTTDGMEINVRRTVAQHLPGPCTRMTFPSLPKLIARERDALSRGHRQVADYVLAHPFHAATTGIEELAALSADPGPDREVEGPGGAGGRRPRNHVPGTERRRRQYRPGDRSDPEREARRDQCRARSFRCRHDWRLLRPSRRRPHPTVPDRGQGPVC